MDNTLIHADIFFFITTIALILLTILLILILTYVVKIVRAFSYIADKLKKESDNVADDIAELRERVKSEGEKVSNFWKFATGFFLNKVTSKFTGGSNARHESRTGRNKKASHTDKDEE
ncbi:MAG: hypothetical protein K9M11_01955 [Candidatus Pacebacteria bacterium]|nr:hypothetical protein [Candidatus Paceibacterota bacterium]